MSVDYPRAWQISREHKMNEHHKKCSYRVTHGALLCDCDIVYKHPEFLSEKMHGFRKDQTE